MFELFKISNLIKNDFTEDYLKLALTIGIFIITSLLSFSLKTRISYLFSWISEKFEWKTNNQEEIFQDDINAMKRATEQIVKDWIRMSKLISQIQNDQRNFVTHLQEQFDVKCKIFEQNISTALGEIFKKNDQRFQEMRLIIEAVKEDMKTLIQTLVEQSSDELDEKVGDGDKKTESSVQTQCEIRKKVKSYQTSCSVKKNLGDMVHDTSKLTATMKTCLTDLFKDAKLHLSVDREEEKRELEIILTKLAEDREDIKKTILYAFSIAAEQSKKNHDQLGQIGENALKYIAALNDNTNQLLNSKLDEIDDVLKNTGSVISRQTHGMDEVKKVIGNVNGRFGELFEKLAQIYQMNMEHSEAVALSLERTSDNWLQNVTKIEKMTKQISDAIMDVKQLFQEMKHLAYTTPQIDTVNEKEKRQIMQNNAIDNVPERDRQILTEKRENMILVYSTWERMRSISCTVEDGCQSVCKLIYGLEEKLGSLNESVEKLDEFIRGLNLDMLAERATSIDYNDDTVNIMDSIMKTNQGDAGDGQSQILTNKLKKETLHKIQNAMAIDSAIKLTEIILGKVCEKNSCQGNESSAQSKPNNAFITGEGSRPIQTADEGQKHLDSMEHPDHKEGSKKFNSSQ